MSIKLGTNTIAGVNQFQTNAGWNIFDFKWSDKIINDISWLDSSTFSWQNGVTYSVAYNHLVTDISGITAETETIGSYTVTFYRATDGHKICLADQETVVSNIFSATGIAWYYILDTTNTRFKLPRTKWGFKGLRDNIGDDISESLPNITGGYSDARACPYPASSVTGAFTGTTNITSGGNYAAGGSGGNIVFNASNSSSTYQDNAPVQERATQMYLYFYVGEYTQTAIEQTAGLNSELFNGKVDKSSLASIDVDYTAGVSISSLPYTCVADGVIDVAISAVNATGQLYINGNKVAHTQSWSTDYTCYLSGQYKVKTNDVVTNSGGTLRWATFFPYGAGSSNNSYIVKGS